MHPLLSKIMTKASRIVKNDSEDKKIFDGINFIVEVIVEGFEEKL